MKRKRAFSNPKIIFVFSVFFFLSFLLPGVIIASSTSGCDRGLWFSQAGSRPAESGEREHQQQRMRENIAALRLWRMTKALDLTEEQAAKIFPLANRIEKEKMEINRQLAQEIRELKMLVAASSPDEAKIKEKIQKINQMRESLRAKDVEFEAFLADNLTVVQRGRYLLFSLDFAQFLNQNIARIKAMKGGKPKPVIKKTP